MTNKTKRIRHRVETWSYYNPFFTKVSVGFVTAAVALYLLTRNSTTLGLLVITLFFAGVIGVKSLGIFLYKRYFLKHGTVCRGMISRTSAKEEVVYRKGEKEIRYIYTAVISYQSPYSYETQEFTTLPLNVDPFRYITDPEVEVCVLPGDFKAIVTNFHPLP